MCNSPPVPVVAVAAVELTNSLIEVANGATALSSSTIVVIVVALVVAGVVVVVGILIHSILYDGEIYSRHCFPAVHYSRTYFRLERRRY